MPKYTVPVELQLYVKSTDPSHAYAEIKGWFDSLRSGDYDNFLQTLRDGTIYISSEQIHEEQAQDLMIEGIEAKHTQKELDEQRARWKADEPNDNPNAEE